MITLTQHTVNLRYRKKKENMANEKSRKQFEIIITYKSIPLYLQCVKYVKPSQPKQNIFHYTSIYIH